MEKEKVLEIEFKEVWDDKWAWKITKNNLDFKNTGGEIVSEDIKIIWSYRESLYLFNNWLAEWEILDNWSLVNSNQKTEIEKFVKYINSTYGIPKRWRAKIGDCYCSISQRNLVFRSKEEERMLDTDLYNLGNYFKTEEEAERVILELDKFWAKVRAGEIGENE